MKPLGVTGVSVQFSEYQDQAAVSCVCDGARYHIWTDSTLSKHEPTLFKNPPIDRQPSDPGYFRTRQLRIDSKFGAQLVAEMLAIVERDGLVEKARAKDREAKAMRERQQAENARIERVREAAPALLAACKQAMLCFPDIMRGSMVEEAIAKAEGRS